MSKYVQNKLFDNNSLLQYAEISVLIVSGYDW